MDRDTWTNASSPPAPLGVTDGIGWGRVEDWLTEHALVTAVTPEEELALDWARYCARRRRGSADRPGRGSDDAQLRHA